MRILLISAFFPPLNNIASSRIASFEHYLKKNGVEVDVITRYYEPEELNGKNLLVSFRGVSTLNEEYFTEGNVIYTNFLENHPRKRTFDKLPPKVKALFGYYHVDIYHYGWLEFVLNAFENQLSSNKYDCIIASSGPVTSFQAAAKISKKYHIPWFADFRDLYIDFETSPIEMFIKKNIQKKLLESASGLLFVSPGMRSFFNKFYKSPKPSEIVYNGFDDESNLTGYSPSDEEVVETFQSIRSRYAIILLHAGSLYKGRNLDFFLPVIEKHNLQSESKVAVVLLGLSNNNFDQQLNSDCFLLPRVSTNTSFYLERQADALLMPIYHDLYTGFSGKVMEYIFTDNIILVEPCKHADLISFLNKYPNAIQLQSTAELEAIIPALVTKSIYSKVQDKKGLNRSDAVDKMLQFIKSTLGVKQI